MAPYDDIYRRNRQLSLSILKRFGFGQSLMETRINDKVDEFVKHVKTTGGRPFDPAETIALSTFNIMASILIGHRFPIEHPTLVTLMTLIHDYVTGIFSPVDVFPLLRYVPPYRGRVKWTNARHEMLLKHLDEMVGIVVNNIA